MRSRMLVTLYIVFFGALLMNLHAQKREIWMTNERMETIFEKYMDVIEGEAGSWQLTYNERIIFVITDEPSNRMRIFTPVIEEKHLQGGEMNNMLKANFHSALDAKYSMYEGFVISVYTHPLKELTEDQLLSATGQVVNLAETFGRTYSSTSLFFGEPIREHKVVEKPLKKS